MNKISPQIEAEGMTAYEQTRAYESLRRKPLLLYYGGLTVLFFAFVGAMLALREFLAAALCLAGAIAFPFVTWRHWRRMRLRHGKNLRRLAELEKEYGETLPWIRMERHFAALEKLQRELKDEAGDGAK